LDYTSFEVYNLTAKYRDWIRVLTFISFFLSFGIEPKQLLGNYVWGIFIMVTNC